MDDIDALKRELQQTRLAYHMAVAINHLKSSFLARVAHELRSPLSSMISLHQIILADLCESSPRKGNLSPRDNWRAVN
jgi:signal transduction histidine kinase